jgi:hypothetical protein
MGDGMSQRGQTLLGHCPYAVTTCSTAVRNVPKGSDPFGTSTPPYHPHLREAA